MPCSAVSGLGLHGLPMSHKKDARLIRKEFLPSSLLCFPCPRSVGKPDACYFFLGFFFLGNTSLFGIKL